MKANELLKTIQNINKSFYTLNDFVKLTGQDKKSVRVALNRLTRTGVIMRLRRNMYVPAGAKIDWELIAEQIVPESYLSFESALSFYNIINQMPYELTMARLGKSRRVKLAGKNISFRRIKKELYGGFVVNNKIKIATPEKALLDLIYLSVRGQTDFDFSELDLSVINKQEIKRVLAIYPYPKQVKERVLTKV